MKSKKKKKKQIDLEKAAVVAEVRGDAICIRIIKQLHTKTRRTK